MIKNKAYFSRLARQREASKQAWNNKKEENVEGKANFEKAA